MNFILGTLRKDSKAEAGFDIGLIYHPPSSTLNGLESSDPPLSSASIEILCVQQK